MDRNRLWIGVVLGQLVISANAATVAPEPRRLGDIQAMLAVAPKLPPGTFLREISVVLLADGKDHGTNEHDYPLWQKRWSWLLGGAQRAPPEAQVNLYGPAAHESSTGALEGAPKVKLSSAWKWPSQEQWASADLIVAFCYLAWEEEQFKQLESFLSRGGGLVLVHSATWTMPAPSAQVARLVGVGGFTRYRHGPVELKIAVDHPICLGLPKQIHLLDETYWPPTPAANPSPIRVLATSDEKTEKDSSGLQPQAMFWTYQPGKGRVFGCVPGHYTWTFDDPCFRVLLLRGMAWAAGESPYRFDPLVLRGARVASANSNSEGTPGAGKQ